MMLRRVEWKRGGRGSGYGSVNVNGYSFCPEEHVSL